MLLGSQNAHGVAIAQRRETAGMAALLVSALRASLASARNRQAIAGLTDQQLIDVGIERSAVLGDRPTIEVEAGVMPYLMSLR